jgi:hypothetical protein
MKLLILLSLVLMKANITTTIKQHVYHNQHKKCFNQLKSFLVLIKKIKENFIRSVLHSLPVINLVNCKPSSPTMKSQRVHIACLPLAATVHQWRTEGGVWVVQTPPPPRFRSFAKAELNSHFRAIYIRKNLIRIWVSLIFNSVEPLTRG